MSASKLAAAYVLGRLALTAGIEFTQVLVWVSALTIVWGTFGAIAQAGSLRRMLAYSAITHAGFIGLAAGSGPHGLSTAAFYAAVYGSMAMLVFAALAGTGAQPDLRTLGRWRALALGLGLFSLSGIPPTPGFWAKLAVLVIAWQFAGPIPTLIAVTGGVFSVLYYLRPVPDLLAALRGEDVPLRPVTAPGVVLAALAVVVLGVFPGLVWALAS
jgi:NADH-quinone oxidoreductase subunit N